MFYITNLLNKKLNVFPGTTKLLLDYQDTSITSSAVRLLRVPVDSSYVTIIDSNNLSKNYGFKNGGGQFTVGAVTVDAVRVIDTSGQSVLDILSALKILVVGANGHNGTMIVTTNSNTLTLTQNSTSLQQTTFVKKSGDSDTSIIIKETSDNMNIFAGSIDESDVYDYKGNTIVGIKKFNINNTIISRFNTSNKFQLDLSSNNNVKINFKYYITNNNKDFLLKNEDVEFLLPETTESDLFKKIRVVLDTQQKKISADNTLKTLQFSFIDLARQYKSVNTSVSLISEDLGNISYSMYNVNTGETIISNSKDISSTLMIFNGKYYIANFYASEVYKNLRVGFVFE